MQAEPQEAPKPIRLRITTALNSNSNDPNQWTPAIWIPRFKMMNPSYPLSELLPVRLKKYVHHYCEKDMILSQRLAEGRQTVLVSCTLRVPGKDSELAIPLNEDPRVETIGDLTSVRCPPEEITIAASLTLTLEGRRKNKNASKVLDDQISTASYIKHGHGPEKWLRVGFVKILGDDGKTWGIRRAAREWECVAYTNPLLGSIDSHGKVLLSKLHGYDFLDFVIGDLEERKPWKELGHSVELLGPFSHPQLEVDVWTEFSSMFKKYVEEKEEDDTLGSGVPFMPTFCYNVFQPGEFGLGLKKWPKHGVELAVRCVIHNVEVRDLRTVSFPRDIRLSIRESDELEDLRGYISKHINVAGMQDGVMVDSDKLFTSRHRPQWTMEFWVMPQGHRKLYRFARGKLSQFLDPSDETRREDKRLYCEAHIISASREQE